ncbi:MAG: FAD-dependent oxidoreductase [Methylococcaceae bacterium]|nr:FAD-dependent oxidoreductase [Methylococcaceae bacterium]
MSNLICCDIAVIGAGAAGIAAAVAAAEPGLKVIVVEKYGFTGGLATSAMVGTICGLYYRSEENIQTPKFAVQGFARKFSKAVMINSHTHPASFAKGLHFIPYQPNVLHQQAALELNKTDVQLILHASLVGLKIKEGRVDELMLNAIDSVFSIKAKAVVDCSGNAQVAMLADLDMIKQPQYQSGAFVFRVIGLPIMEPSVLSLNLIRWIKYGIEQGDLDSKCERLSIVPGTVNNESGLLKLGMEECFMADKVRLSEYELEMRSLSMKIIKFLSKLDPLLKKLSISSMATQVGIRTGPRHEGISLLEEEHVLSCTKPDDGVAIGAWPIEYWGKGRKPEMSYFKVNDYYLIPAGALVSKHLKNLFFGGRTISATERAIASARVIGTCLGTGYAAGGLAAEFVREGDWKIALEKIRTKQVFAEAA